MSSHLWEVSFECGNRVGGIWTVITSKAPFMKRHFGDRYFAVGFYDPKKTEFIEKGPPAFLQKAFGKLRGDGLDFHYGKWVDADDANLVLVDSRGFTGEADRIKKELWESYGIDSLGASHDFNEPMAWSYAVGRLLDEVAGTVGGDHAVQLHEWLSAGTLFYLQQKARNRLPTVFTTHATVLGRAIGSRDIPGNPDERAREEKVTAKHLAEKAAARNADVFTTVSDGTGEEARKALGRAPDVLTYNALNGQAIPDLPRLMNDKVVYRRKIDDFVRSYFFPYYSMDMSDYPVIYTAGRYEFHNKGYDTFIDALGEVNRRLKAEEYPGWFMTFILVPAGTLGVKDEVIQNFVFYRHLKEVLREDIEKISEELYKFDVGDELVEESVSEIMMDFKRMKSRLKTRRGRTPPLCAFQLAGGESQDPILQRLKANELLNRPEDRVKVVYYPLYINRQDELLGLRYRDFLTAASMGVFLSRYEPWGYTPMEAAAFLSTTVTTNKAGFAMAAQKLASGGGLHIADVSGDSSGHVADIIDRFVKSSKEVRISQEIGAHKLVKDNFVWEKLGGRYLEAYKKARSSASHGAP